MRLLTPCDSPTVPVLLPQFTLLQLCLTLTPPPPTPTPEGHQMNSFVHTPSESHTLSHTQEIVFRFKRKQNVNLINIFFISLFVLFSIFMCTSLNVIKIKL